LVCMVVIESADINYTTNVQIDNNILH